MPLLPPCGLMILSRMSKEVHEGVGDVDAVVHIAHHIDIIVTDYGAVTSRMIEAALV
jgi:hypothetical protein